MSTLASLLGSGAGAVVIAVAMVTDRHLGRIPLVGRAIIDRLVIVLMYAGGAAIAVTKAGSWIDDIVRLATGWLGGLNAPIPRTALVIVALFLLAAVAVSLIWEPGEATGIVAAVLPLALGLVAGGFIHQVYLATVVPGQALASAISSWVGG